jgi:hypothetical protein
MKAVRCRPHGDSGVLVYEDAGHRVPEPGHTPPTASRACAATVGLQSLS